MSREKLTITMPEAPEEREELLTFLEARGLLDPEPVGRSGSKKGRWAKVAEEMSRRSLLRGKSQEVLEDIQDFRRGFEVRETPSPGK